MPVRASLLSAVNRLGGAMPRRLRRFIADFPGVLPLLERLSGGSAVEVRTPEGYRLLLSPLFHANLLAEGGLAGYEPDLRRAITALAKPGMVAYDVGANVGVFSLAFAGAVGGTGRVYAFEPERNNHRYLEQTARLNALSNVVVDTRALGPKTALESFDRRGGAFSGRLVAGNESYERSDNVVSVQMASVDDLVAKEGYRPPDIVKIDVEGNEGAVLEGMANTLASRHPLIICEMHFHLGDPVSRAANLLRQHGYRFWPIEVLEPDPAQEIRDLTSNRHIIARWGGPAG